VDPAIKKRVDLYRSLVLLGPRDECASPNGAMLSFYGDRVVEEGVGSPAALVRAMLGRDHYGADVLKMACDCFQLARMNWRSAQSVKNSASPTTSSGRRTATTPSG
jgi:hypothetical protein